MFTYIKPEFMIHAFCGQRDNILLERSICVARLGDLAVQMSKVDENSFALSLENINDGSQYSGRVFNITNSTEKDIVPVVEELFKRMQLLNDQEIFDKRERIWKWYAMDWLEQQGISLDDYIDSRMAHNSGEESVHWKSLEDYLSSEYLSMAQTMDIINRFATCDSEKEELNAFVARDIIELRKRYSLEAMQEAFDARNQSEENRRRFSFVIEVEAEDQIEAREKLDALLQDEKDIIRIRG